MPNQIVRARASRLHHLWAVPLAAMSCYAAGVRADDAAGASMFSLSGFGTLGAVHSSDDTADFTSSSFKPDGAGYTHPWSTDVDTRFGAQLTGTLTPQLSVVLQVISEQNYDNTYKPHVEWANINYQVMPDLSIRAGRTVLPSFLFADSRKVGYAMPWIRPPVDLYSLVPIASSDGGDATYRFQFGNAVNTVAGTYGKTDSRMPSNGSSHARQQWAFTDTLEYGRSTVYVTYHEAHLTVTSLDAFFDAFRAFGPQGIAIADRYDSNDKPLRFFGFGGIYDRRTWFLIGEWGTTNLHSALGASTGWYTSGGYRWASFTPYLTYGAVKPHSNASDPGLNVQALPAPLMSLASGLNAGLNAVLGSIPNQSTISWGVRWDFVRNVDLKLQGDHTRFGAGSAGTLINVQPDFRRGGTVNLLSIGIDFVW